MSIVIDDLDLIRRVQDGILEEIRNISYINIIDRRNIVELEIPGSQGNIIQDMGFDAIKVELFGEIMGQNARTSIESLRDKYESNKPLSFSSDHENVLKSFLVSENVKLGDFYFMGHKTKKGAYGVVAEIIV